MKYLSVLFVLLFFSTGCTSSRDRLFPKLPYTILGNGGDISSGDYQNIQIPKEDYYYSSVIWNSEGLDKFMKRYPISLNVPKGFFQKKLIIVVFSDTHYSITIDGFSPKFVDSYYFFVDIRSFGIMAVSAPLPKGKVNTAWAAISVDRPQGIAHVAVRDVVGGLSMQYGKNELEQGSPADAGQ